MKTSHITLALLSLISLAQAQITMPERSITRTKLSTTVTGLTAITNVQMNAAIASIDTTSTTPYFIFSNVRATSATTTTNDLLRVRYPVSKTSLDLKSAQVQVFKDIGVFDEINTLFMKNVPAIAAMRYGTATMTYAAGSSHSFSGVDGTKPFVFDLVSGQSVGFQFHYVSTPCYIAFTRSATAPKAAEFTGLVSSNFYQDRLAVLDTGRYYLWMKPQVGASASVRLSFHNENATTLGSAVSGTVISGSLRSSVRDYLKWKIRLVKGQDIILTQTGGYDIQWRVVAADGSYVGSFFRGGSGTTTFSPLVNAALSADYYLVAEKSFLTSGSTVRATVTIGQ
jgi:hypothetical protein